MGGNYGQDQTTICSYQKTLSNDDPKQINSEARNEYTYDNQEKLYQNEYTYDKQEK